MRRFFCNSKASAGALDGWQPKELSLLSQKAYDAIAVLLNQIEEGEDWPRSAEHAKAAGLRQYCVSLFMGGGRYTHGEEQVYKYYKYVAFCAEIQPRQWPV